MSKRQSTHDAEQDDRNDHIKIYVNGNIVPRQEAVVSVYDSGFMLGDGVWEGLRLYHGKLSFLDEHIRRLYDAAKTLDMDIGLSKTQLIQAVQDTLQANDMHHDVHVRLMVTRGVKRKPFQDPRLSQDGPTIVIIAEHSKVSEQFEDQVLRLHTVPFYRGLPMTQDAKLNTHSKLNCIIALNHALKVGADEALMLDPYGFVNTTNSTNFFIVRDGEVWTSSGDYCMAGITRKKVIQLCRENDIPAYEKNYSLTDAYTADEAFVTGTFGAQTWVKEIDGHTIGEGTAGPMFRKLRTLYKELVGATQ